MTVADAALAALLRDAAESAGGAEPPIEELRAAGRARARQRPPGPEMATADATVAGVPVRWYQPERATTIVYAHGGGFVLGDLDSHDAVVRRLAAATGARVVAVDYRRAPEHPFPAAVEDVAAVAAHAAGQGPVAVAGDSAGGLLAALAAQRLRGHPALIAQLLVCPNTDLTLGSPSVTEKGRGWLLDTAVLRDWIALWAPDPAVRASAAASPLAARPADLAGLPPALVVTAEHDPLRDEGDAYARRLAAAGVAVRHRVEPGLIHNFPTLRHVSPACAAAEDRYLADAAALLVSAAGPPGGSGAA